LSLLKFESNLVCASCRHDKMIIASHSLVNIMMTEQSGQLLHMDTVGLSWAHYIGGKWYVLIIVDDYSCYSWIFFLKSRDKVFDHFRSLALRLNNEHPSYLKAIYNDNVTEFRNVFFDQFCLEHGVDQQFSTLCVPQ
jgi:transposase InsO family protein